MTKTLFILTIPWLLTRCATPPPALTCPQRDWFEVGRQDGTLGKSFQHFFTYQKQCSQNPNQPDPILYTNGRNAGLIEYCSPQNALEVGKSGRAYQGVCPEYLEVEFIDFYKKGKRIFTLQKDNAQIDSKVQGIFHELTRQVLNSENRLILEKQIKNLRKKRTRNISEIQKLEKEASTF